jgi:SAM-dependent methyltransferase
VNREFEARHMTLYDTIGRGYAALRRPDPRIAAAIDAALGDAVSVVNIGAGAGSYEPPGRTVLAVEPSEVMIRQRPAGAAPCVRGSAEALPLETQSVDAAMAILSAHHWTDLERGLREMARVARKRVVLLTWVPDALHAAPFWLTEEYFPEIAAHDRTIFPGSAALTTMLERAIAGSRPARMTPVPIPHDCTDGLLCAYWRRPESYLNSEVRSAISSFARIDAEDGLAKLRADLSSGRWADRNRALLAMDALDAGYRIVCCEVGDPKR